MATMLNQGSFSMHASRGNDIVLLPNLLNTNRHGVNPGSIKRNQSLNLENLGTSIVAKLQFDQQTWQHPLQRSESFYDDSLKDQGAFVRNSICKGAINSYPPPSDDCYGDLRVRAGGRFEQPVGFRGLEEGPRSILKGTRKWRSRPPALSQGRQSRKKVRFDFSGVVHIEPEPEEWDAHRVLSFTGLEALWESVWDNIPENDLSDLSLSINDAMSWVLRKSETQRYP